MSWHPTALMRGSILGSSAIRDGAMALHSFLSPPIYTRSTNSLTPQLEFVLVHGTTFGLANLRLT